MHLKGILFHLVSKWEKVDISTNIELNTLRRKFQELFFRQSKVEGARNLLNIEEKIPPKIQMAREDIVNLTRKIHKVLQGLTKTWRTFLSSLILCFSCEWPIWVSIVVLKTGRGATIHKNRSLVGLVKSLD